MLSPVARNAERSLDGAERNQGIHSPKQPTQFGLTSHTQVSRACAIIRLLNQ
ncbi:Uncharacterised protein [Legionella donaldsonii]|uniref:Uncharacterized protein n=1 Tax=Legionella donaldsonii TaxID=45060 RepID=A0A378J2C0_9GAMM|nr:Uncharacterised protein [Legionella donaldsonii]